MKKIFLLVLSVLSFCQIILSAEMNKGSGKKHIAVIVDVDKLFVRGIPEDRLEKDIKNILEQTGYYSLADLKNIPPKEKTLIKSYIRKGMYTLAVDVLTRYVGGLDLWLFVVVVKNFQEDGSVYCSYQFYDLKQREKFYNFIESPVIIEENAVVSALKKYIVRPPASMSSKVDIFKPISVLFLVDNSGSMKKNDNDFNSKDQIFFQSQTARANAIKLIMNRLTVNDEYAFVFFSEKTRVFQDWFVKIKSVKEISALTDRVISFIAMDPGTDIGEAFKKTKEILTTTANSNKYIIFMSDGNPTMGEKDFKTLKQYSQDNFKDTAFFVIGLDAELKTKGYHVEKAFLKNLAYDSGGMMNIIKINETEENRYAETSLAVDSIFNSIRKEQTIMNEEPAYKTIVQDKIVYSWDFKISSECSEFNILIEPYEDNYIVELMAPDGQILPKENITVVPLAKSANCKISRPECKGQWKLNVKIPQQ